MTSEKGFLVRALLLVAALHLLGLGVPHLLEPDEGRYADIAREVLDGAQPGSWIVPRVNGTPFWDKPPLVIWLAALSMKLLGTSAFALRLVPALFGIGAAGAAAWLAREVYGRGAALAALVYATCPLALGVGRVLVLDVPLTALVAIGAGLVLKGAGVLRSPPSRGASVLGGVALGLATLVKGPVAIGLAGLAVIPALVLVRDRETRLRLLSPLPWLVALLVSAPWFLLAEKYEPGFLDAFFVGENLKRFGGKPFEHIHGPFFYLGVLAWGLGPWAVAGLALVLGRARETVREDPISARTRAILLAFAALTTAFFSFSSTKVETYVLPAFPAVACVIAGEMARVLESGSARERRAVELGFGAVAAVFALAPVAGVLLGLHVFELTSERGKLFQEATVPWLALLPLPLVVVAILRARAGRALPAVLALALALLAAIPFVLQPVRAATRSRSAELVAREVEFARASMPGTTRIASFHYYYRGLPFFLGEPVILLGEKGELHDESLARRPDLFFEDAKIVTFLKENRPLVVAMPKGQERALRFLSFCSDAGFLPEFVGAQDDDIVFKLP